jgi:kynurenine formamidase
MFFEISYVLGETIPRWPTNPIETPDINLSFEKGDPCNATSIYHHMHNGTHVDAPKHFSRDGRGIVEIPIEDFYYTAPLILKLEKKRGQVITQADLFPFEAEIAKADILCAYTGYADIRGQDPQGFVDNFPAFSPDAAYYLRTHFPDLKAVAIDTISVESAVDGPKNGFPVHRTFLDKIEGKDLRTLLLYEDVNLQKLASIDQPLQAISAFPIRWEGAEAAPVNMVAFC